MIQKFLASKFSGYVAVALMVALLGLFGFVYYKGKMSCLIGQIKNENSVMEKRNAIANKRPDSDATVKRLLNGTF